MSFPAENWQAFSRPHLGLRWRYPTITPQGCVVEVVEEQLEGVTRVHLMSRDSAEVYFEVRRFPDLLPANAYERHRADLAQRFAQAGCAITELIPTQLRARPAHAYTFQWQQYERAAVLIPDGRALYRIIYDPRSAPNSQILATVTFGGDPPP